MPSENYTLITGATSGIGLAIVRNLARSRRLMLAGRNSEKLEAVRRECANPEQHLVWMQDLALPAGIGESLTAGIIASEAGVDHFIHAAGMFEIGLARSFEMERLQRLFDVNVFSAVEIIRVLASKRANKLALRSITLISSIATRIGARGYSAYAASKGALNSLARSLAVELAPQVRVNTILPGGIETEGTRHLFANPEFRAAAEASYPLGAGRVEDIANAVEFVISDKARWITGQEIVVDGGRTMNISLK